MLQYVCDNCERVKADDEEWVLGFAVERLGVRAARREVTIAPVWDENRAVQWFAVHFCSEECKDSYLEKLFGTAPPGATDVIESTLVAKKKVVPANVATKTKRVSRVVRRHKRKVS